MFIFRKRSSPQSSDHPPSNEMPYLNQPLTRSVQPKTNDSRRPVEEPEQIAAEYEEIGLDFPQPIVYDEVRNLGRPDVTSSEYEGLQRVEDNDYLQPYQTITS